MSPVLTRSGKRIIYNNVQVQVYRFALSAPSRLRLIDLQDAQMLVIALGEAHARTILDYFSLGLGSSINPPLAPLTVRDDEDLLQDLISRVMASPFSIYIHGFVAGQPQARIFRLIEPGTPQELPGRAGP